MRQNRERLESSASQLRIRLRSGLILLNLLDVVLILVIIFFPSNMLRIILVTPFLLFSPGYALLVAIFARKEEIGGIERVILSFGLSVVVVSLMGLILNYSPWGIRLESILYSIVSLILITSIMAWLRQRKMTENERFSIKLNLTLLAWVKNTKDRVLIITLVLVILGALGVLVYGVTIPKGGEAFTEFYVLGQQGKSGDYPDKLKVGDEGKVILGIINHEGVEASYLVKVVIGSNTTNIVGPMVLVDKQNWEGEMGFIVKVPGQDQKVEFVLYKDGEVEPYRELQIWVDVTE